MHQALLTEAHQRRSEMKDDLILRYSVFVRYLPPAPDDPNAVSIWQHLAAGAKRAWASACAALRPTSREENEEAYLAQATTHADLERRMNDLAQRHPRQGPFWPI
jgi:hypothetical protein